MDPKITRLGRDRERAASCIPRMDGECSCTYAFALSLYSSEARRRDLHTVRLKLQLQQEVERYFANRNSAVSRTVALY